MGSFLLCGKAKNVFRLLEIITEMAKEELEEIHGTEGHPCPYSPVARCAKPEDKTCAELDCLIWKDIDGE